MLGLADLQNNLGKYKKRIYSITLVCLLVFSGLLGAFIHFDNTFVKAASNTDDFEDELEGSPPPGTDTWYTFYVNPAAAGEYNITTDQSFGTSSQSWNLTSLSDPNMPLCINLTTASNYRWVNFSYYPTPIHEYLKIYFKNDSSDPIDAEDTMIWLILGYYGGDWGSDGLQRVMVRGNYSGAGGDYYAFATFEDNTWNNISVCLNYTDHTFKIWHYNGTITNDTSDGLEHGNQPSPTDQGNGWYKFYVGVGEANPNVNNELGYLFVTGGGNINYKTNCYIDNLFVGDSGGELGYPSINGTLFNSSLTIVGSTYSITFSGNQSDILWCNSSDGGGLETMEVAISDGNTSVLWCNVTLYDVGTSPQIGAEQFFLYGSVDQVSWYNFTNFPVGGGTLVVNGSTWDTAGGTGDNPFPISAADTLYFRFKLVVPGSQTETTYTQITGCSVSIGG